MNRHPRLGITLLLAGLAMFGPFAIDTMFPAFPVIGAEFGADPTLMQQTLSVYLIAYALMSLFHGPLSDRFGRRIVILGGVAAFTLASVGCALSWSIESLLTFRAIQGISAGAGLIVGRAIIRDLYEGSAAQKLMSNITMLFGVAPALAPIIGGFVLGLGHWRWIFWFLTLWAGSLLVSCAWRLPETHPVSRRVPFSARALFDSYGMMVRDAHFWPLAIATTFNFSALFVYISSAPAFVIDLLGLGPQQFAWLFVPAVTGIVLGSVISGRMAGRASAEYTVGIGYGLMLVACALNLLVALWLPQPRVPWSVLPIGLHGMGMALTSPTLTLLLLDRFPTHRGGVSSMQAFVSLVFNAVLAGAIVIHLSDSAMKLALGATLMSLIGFVAWRVYRRRAKRELARHSAAGPESVNEEAGPM